MHAMIDLSIVPLGVGVSVSASPCRRLRVGVSVSPSPCRHPIRKWFIFSTLRAAAAL